MRAERFGTAKAQERGRVPHATVATLRQYTSRYFLPGTDPRALRKRDEGRPIGLEHLANSRRWLELYIWPDPIARMGMAEIRRTDILDFRHRLVRRLGERRNTINKVMATLKVPFREALYAGHIGADPTVGVGTVRETRRTPGVLSGEELRELFPKEGPGPWRRWGVSRDGKRVLEPDERARAAFLLAATTGMRRGEILALRWSAVDLERATLAVERAWKRRERKDGDPKSGKPRITPLPAVTVRALEALRDAGIRHHPTDFVFCHDDGERMGESWWRDRFRAALEVAGSPTAGRRLVPHSLRHSLATIAAATSYDPEKNREPLGWADEEVRRLYTHLGAEHLRGLAEIVDRVLG